MLTNLSGNLKDHAENGNLDACYVNSRCAYPGNISGQCYVNSRCAYPGNISGQSLASTPLRNVISIRNITCVLRNVK